MTLATEFRIQAFILGILSTLSTIAHTNLMRLTRSLFCILPLPVTRPNLVQILRKCIACGLICTTCLVSLCKSCTLKDRFLQETWPVNSYPFLTVLPTGSVLIIAGKILYLNMKLCKALESCSLAWYDLLRRKCAWAMATSILFAYSPTKLKTCSLSCLKSVLPESFQ